MKIKFTTPVLVASLSLTAFIASLFTPLFFAIILAFGVTISVWEISHVVAIACVALLLAIILVPLIKPTGKSWLFPVILGLVIFALACCAFVYSFSPLAERFNLYFHPYGLIALIIGAVLCTAEGFMIRSHLRCINLA